MSGLRGWPGLPAHTPADIGTVAARSLSLVVRGEQGTWYTSHSVQAQITRPKCQASRQSPPRVYAASLLAPLTLKGLLTWMLSASMPCPVP
jgi:hypothetical protein